MFQSQPPECPCISIIIPVYNAGPYLGECLDSLLSQTFQDWEAICIADGLSLIHISDPTRHLSIA